MSHVAWCLKETGGGGGGGAQLNELGKASVIKAEFLVAGKVYKAIFWPSAGLKDCAGIPAEGTLISASKNTPAQSS